ncbi:metal ABC transporter ATP-binding protein [Solibacillus sp. MA9]|uniref:Metal ABC transporter ATP-binding protein n=1 Tax=Solibacillus palustris TaxID=2908203 RepID=A0ABS9U828_9BACL|nr:metal ABC transporter ATP-binding protein [Solibacillus sp. MA9]MCH7320495.1 metal ABC transporter ATP-binding protein [Solibacillus sp. MA9]
MSIKQRFRTSMKKVNGDLLTPISIFQRLQGERKFLLESSMKYEGHGRYSFIGVNPRKTYRGEQEQLSDLSHLTNKQYTYEGELIALLKQVMPRVSSHTEYPFTGGGIGYIEAVPDRLPKLQFHVYDTLVIFDHLTDEIAVFQTNIEAEQVEPNIDAIIDKLFTNPIAEETSYTLHTIESQVDGQYTAQFSGDAFALYRKLRIEHAAPYMYYMEFDDCTVVGTSDHNYLQVRDGTLSATNEAPSIERFCQSSNYTTNNVQNGELNPTFHAIDVVKALKPAQGLIGYIGFNGQVDFTTPENMITITGDIAQIRTDSTTGVPFATLLKG